MTSTAVQQGDTIPKLKEDIANLKSQTEASFDIPVDRIVPLQLPENMHQPRLYFDSHRMELLKNSIHKYGVLEPILLRPGQAGKLELISGERRWRCCLALKIPMIPGIVREMSDTVALEAAIIAHLLSEEISLIEQTESILSLLSLRLGLSAEDLKTSLYQIKNARVRGLESISAFSEQQISIINEILGEFGIKVSSFVSNRLPLLNLSPIVLAAVKANKLSPTNAVLINRQPKEYHASLISQAEGYTKSELVSLIKATVIKSTVANSSASKNGLTEKKEDISEKIYHRIQSVRKRTTLLQKPEVVSRLTKIEQLLKEIEDLKD
ncbi:MAG: ParB/RepB/Spo0J family partition protein [Phormidesmis sp.]